jgi:phage terminase small subunit
MPAPKPAALHTRHSTKPEIEKRAAQEEALTPQQRLPALPRRLKGHSIAEATWRRMMGEYAKIDAVLVTRLDMDQLVDYCILEEQKTEIDQMRKAAYESMLILVKARDAMLKAGNTQETAKLAERVIDKTNEVIQLDGRADRKRDLLLKLRQSLYLTPRARAGAAPKTKVDEPPEDPFEQLLNSLPVHASFSNHGLDDGA